VAEIPQASGPASPREIRVGLATDLESLTLPCCDGAARVLLAAGERILAAPLRVEPGVGVSSSTRYRLQVAALKDEAQAQALARTWSERLKQPADAQFDAGTDLYRVRVGSWPTREGAEQAKGRLASQGLSDGWIAQEGSGLVHPSLRVTQGGETFEVPGRWLRVAGEDGFGLRFKGQRYRGRLAVFLNERGRLNLVNELSLEAYLRGVVPKEMGPFLYDELEALKAQAVAARSYTLRHLGEFEGEGYDICATPRCHVYGGMDAEQALTDRALAETAGEVVAYQGQTADTLYTATCGGQTENVEVIFPTLTDRPYLRSVPCLEEGLESLAGSLPRGTALAGGLAHRLLPARLDAAAPERLEGQLRRLAELAGLPMPVDRLESTDRREVQRFIASLFDLALDARLFVAPADLPYLIEEPPPGWDEEALRQGALLVRSGLFTAPLDTPLEADEVDHLLIQLALLVRVLEVEPVRFQGLTAPELRVRKEGGQEETLSLPAGVPTFRRLGDEARAGTLTLVAGDRLELYRQGSEIVALVQEVQEAGVAFDRRSKRSHWTRFHTDQELAASVHERYPGLGFQTFEILGRGASGRVAKIRLVGSQGRQVEVEGLAVRWTLDVPETLFTATRVKPAGKPAGWLFRGRGWGHGVGMCQEGAFGMAQRGHGYREILAHYYPGTEILRLTPE
jgi:stage II sporulation protein D